MTLDELEFAISQYLDGSLPAAEAAELEARFEVDADARQLLEEYRRLDDVLKQSPAAPELQWGRLAEHLSSAVEVEAERLEQTCVEFVDGTLAPAEMDEFRARAADDPRASDLVEQHRRLRGALKALPQPAVRWDRLAEHLYDTAVGEPASYKISAYRWMRVAGGLAVAACVMIVSAVGLRMHLHHGSNGGSGIAVVTPDNKPAVAVISISGMDDALADAKQPAATGGVEVSIGAGADQQDPAGGSEFAGIVTASAPRSLAAANAPTAAAEDDAVQMPY